MIENIRVGGRAKNQLTALKRRTGIANWNVLCRWAFCVSLREKSAPRGDGQTTDSGVEMTWRTFAGQYDEIFLALLKQRCSADGLTTDVEELQRQLRRHLHRGIGYLASKNGIKSIDQLIELAVT